MEIRTLTDDDLPASFALWEATEQFGYELAEEVVFYRRRLDGEAGDG